MIQSTVLYEFRALSATTLKQNKTKQNQIGAQIQVDHIAIFHLFVTLLRSKRLRTDQGKSIELYLCFRCLFAMN
jgi:hypothetical protein